MLIETIANEKPKHGIIEEMVQKAKVGGCYIKLNNLTDKMKELVALQQA